MQKIMLSVFPSFIGEMLAQGSILPEELNDCDKLTTILSEYSVNKIVYLNKNIYTTVDSMSSDGVKDRTSELFMLDIFKSYVVNNSFTDDVSSAVPSYTAGPILAALCKVGDEAIVPSLTQSLHQFALPFKVYRIKHKTYGVVFQPLCEVNSPCERLSKYLKDMEALVSLVSLELTDSELLDEDLYQHYLSLI